MGTGIDWLDGLLQLALISLVPVAVISLLLRAGSLSRGAGRIGRRAGVLPAPEPVADRRPIGRVAADVRRLAAAVDDLGPGTSHAKATGTVLAYDDALREACAALEVPEQILDRRRQGRAVEERRRVEAALEDAGLQVRPRRRA